MQSQAFLLLSLPMPRGRLFCDDHFTFGCALCGTAAAVGFIGHRSSTSNRYRHTHTHTCMQPSPRPMFPARSGHHRRTTRAHRHRNFPIVRCSVSRLFLSSAPVPPFFSTAPSPLDAFCSLLSLPKCQVAARKYAKGGSKQFQKLEPTTPCVRWLAFVLRSYTLHPNRC